MKARVRRGATGAAAGLALACLAMAPDVALAADDGDIAFTVEHPQRRTGYQTQFVHPDGSGRRLAFTTFDGESGRGQWSPDGEWLRFSTSKESVIARPDGSDARTFGSSGAWSADGTQFVYTFRDVREDQGVREIWVMNADGTDRHRIYEGPGVRDVAWSPRGDAIAFVQTAPTPEGGALDAIFTIDPTGGNLRQLTVGSGVDHRVVTDWEPAWSPDGSRIAFRSTRLQRDCQGICPDDVFVMNSDGTHLVGTYVDGGQMSLTWAPSGREVAFITYNYFSADPTPTPYSVSALSLKTGKVRDIVTGDRWYEYISWGAKAGSMPTGDLRSSLRASATTMLSTSAATYAATVTNAGRHTARRAFAEIVLPPGAEVLLPQAGCTGTTRVRCTLGDVPAGASRSVSVTASAPDVGVHEASVMATSATPDTEFLDNRAVVPTVTCTALGGAAADSLVGTAGDDVLCGGAGDDAIVGLGGNDVVVPGTGNDRVDGGAGTDTVSYVTAPRGVTVDLAERRATGDGTDALAGFERVVGSRYADLLHGSGTADTLSGGPGDDLLAGRSGNDLLEGGPGSDRLVPSVGDDRVDGGTGDDLVDFRRSRRGVSVDLHHRRASGEGTDRLTTVEDIRGSRFRDLLTGSSIGNVIRGGGGRDRIVTLGGDDRADGDRGDDDLKGGDGNDRLVGGPGVDRCRQNYGRGANQQCEKK
jgi:Ca2+-binding RTX toxin-like protein